MDYLRGVDLTKCTKTATNQAKPVNDLVAPFPFTRKSSLGVFVIEVEDFHKVNRAADLREIDRAADIGLFDVWIYLHCHVFCFERAPAAWEHS